MAFAGTDLAFWTPPPAGGYSAPAANFDGTNDYGTNTTLTGLTSSGIGLASVWHRRTSTGTGLRRLFRMAFTNNVTNFAIYHQNDAIFILGQNTGGTAVLTGSLALDDADFGWHHDIISWDLSSSSNRDWYRDGSVASPTWSVYTISGSVGYGTSTRHVGLGAQAAGTEKWVGDLGPMFVKWGGSYVTAASRLSEFIAGGVPPAAAPTDGMFVFDGDETTYMTNLGTLGNIMTVVGALSAASLPVQV